MLPEVDEYAVRVMRVDEQMAEIRQRVSASDFEVVRPGRWRYLPEGLEVETGYTYGEGRLRVYSKESGRQPQSEFVVSGRVDDLAEFNRLFPVCS